MEDDTKAKLAGITGAGVVAAGSLGLVSSTGAVAGLGATGITSGLAAVGGVIGGGMLAGLATIAVAPIAAGLTTYAAYRWFTSGEDEDGKG